MIGDDEYCWSDNGVLNIEGGCYVKCIDLLSEKELEIWNVIKFGIGESLVVCVGGEYLGGWDLYFFVW